ncbi:hypothetical protein E2C01_048582 [Portunus trituberculatus]|uniref:Secreted protein n=1 Tax=Portunus trituberculatus TaxID=210409 RepID=A0A5B7GAL3_PORTR|nr:hypothetical protein [Portunus trituberculatus]
MAGWIVSVMVVIVMMPSITRPFVSVTPSLPSLTNDCDPSFPLFPLSVPLFRCSLIDRETTSQTGGPSTYQSVLSQVSSVFSVCNKVSCGFSAQISVSFAFETALDIGHPRTKPLGHQGFQFTFASVSRYETSDERRVAGDGKAQNDVLD